ncbi:hypothetical protein KUV73_25070 [Mameliella alba]|nr:hypothetical protein [Mameliella alba]MBY6172672.1 hypothetical protein [Mameliella alba]MBY6177654.1 hypothetical protein [Mameliella alba]
METTTAKIHDSQIRDEFLQGEETSAWTDKGSIRAMGRAVFSGPNKCWGIMHKAPKGLGQDLIDADINRIIAVARAKSENPFRVLKRYFGHMYPRYRGLANKRASYFTLFGLGNFFFRAKLMA